MTISTNLNAALGHLAKRFGFDFSELALYAAENTLGGYHPDQRLEQWPIGSMFGVEGQVIYSLVRALKPLNVINIGVYHGCSVAHIAAALLKNGNPKARVHAVDLKIIDTPLMPDELKPYIVEIESDGLTFLEGRWPAKTTLLFEDCLHDEQGTREMWEVMLRKANLGSLIISHDTQHHIVGQDVRNGIEGAGVNLDDGLSLLIEPSDCGLFIYRQTKDA